MIAALEEAPMAVAETTDKNELVQEIEKYLTEFNHDLLDGGMVRDALLDLMNIAKGN